MQTLPQDVAILVCLTAPQLRGLPDAFPPIGVSGVSGLLTAGIVILLIECYLKQLNTVC